MTGCSQGVSEERFGIGLGGPVGTFHTPPPPVVAVFEHVVVLWVKGPVVALLLRPSLAGHLHETLVQTQVVPYTILPPLRSTQNKTHH